MFSIGAFASTVDSILKKNLFGTTAVQNGPPPPPLKNDSFEFLTTRLI